MRTLLLLFFCGCFISINAIAQNPLAIPDSLHGPVYNLVVQEDSVQFLAGPKTPTYGYNGAILGPTLFMNKGESVQINVMNLLQDPTTVHWHGLHVPAEDDGGPHQLIQSGQSWSPVFDVMNHAGTFWYHPHGDGYTEYQVTKGLAGVIIVKDSLEATYNLPSTYGVDDFPLVIQSKSFDILNQLAAFTHDDSLVLINGTLNPYLSVPSQMVRLRLLDGSADRSYYVGLSNNMNFQVIGSDGGLLSAPVSTTRLLISPGERYEIIVDFGSMMGQTVNLMSYSSQLPNNIIGSNQVSAGPATLPGYAANPLNGADFTLLQLTVVGQTANPVLSIPAAFQPIASLPVGLADTTRQITFAPEMMSPQNMISGPFTLNGSSFDMDSVNIVIPIDNMEIWSLVNNTMVAHPFHIHDVEFQILDRNGVAVAPIEAGWKDVVLVKPMETVRFITKFEDFSNDSVPYMYHCHLLHHEDEGMMGAFVVTNGLTSGLSNVEKNGSLLFPNPAVDQLTLVARNATEPVVVDLIGRHRPVNVSKSEPGWIIHTDQLESGVYILRYYAGGEINLIKFVRL